MMRTMPTLAILGSLVYLGTLVSLVGAAEPEEAAVIDLTFEQLKFDGPTKEKPFDRAMLGKAIEELDGKRVRIRGYMIPSYQEKVSKFVLVRDNQSNFAMLEPIWEHMVVDMVGDKRAQFSTSQVLVTGKFTIKERRDQEGVVRCVYNIDADSVK